MCDVLWCDTAGDKETHLSTLDIQYGCRCRINLELVHEQVVYPSVHNQNGIVQEANGISHVCMYMCDVFFMRGGNVLGDLLHTSTLLRHKQFRICCLFIHFFLYTMMQMRQFAPNLSILLFHLRRTVTLLNYPWTVGMKIFLKQLNCDWAC